jgi:uncharacterized Zn finger protein
MGWREWGEWEYRPRIRPVDGIRAKTQRGKFGTTWWAGRWLAALERLVDEGRLSRGRSYARGGQVTKLDAGTKGVDAQVQGSMPRPYKVTLRFRRLDDNTWDAVAGALAAQAIYAAKLLAGEMPEDVEEAFSSAGASLFPATAGDMESNCSCPDWSNPCKHVAAVYYLLGERFDEDPFLIFELRGRTKEQIVEALRARRATGGAPALAAPPAEVEGAPDEDEPPAEAPAPLLSPAAAGDASPADAFWLAGAALDEVTFAFGAPRVDGLPAKVRGAPPQWPKDEDFATTAERTYKAIGDRALRLATEGK